MHHVLVLVMVCIEMLELDPHMVEGKSLLSGQKRNLYDEGREMTHADTVVGH